MSDPNYTEIPAGSGIFASDVVPFGSLGVIFTQDSITGAIVTMDEAHKEIHDGDHYVTTDVQTYGAGTAGTIQKYLIKTQNIIRKAHMLIRVSVNLGCTISFFETPTVTANGALLSAVNNNRVSTNFARTSIFNTPTTTANGTLLKTEQIGSATTAGIYGGRTSSDRNEQEFILNSGTNYLLTITTLADGTTISTEFNWYETPT